MPALSPARQVDDRRCRVSHPLQPPIGRQGFSANFSAAHPTPLIHGIGEREEVVIVGRVAYPRSRDALSMTPIVVEKSTHLDSDRITIFRQQPDARWLLAPPRPHPITGPALISRLSLPREPQPKWQRPRAAYPTCQARRRCINPAPHSYFTCLFASAASIVFARAAPRRFVLAMTRPVSPSTR